MKQTKKILIITLSAGAGHIIVGKALEEEAKNFKDVEVKNIDMADYLPVALKAIIIDSYELIAKKTPDLYRFVYDKTDHPGASHLLDKILNIYKKISNDRFLAEIKDFDPDYIISTHFLPAFLLKNIPKEKIRCPVATIITDYETHEFWFSSVANHYFVASPKMKWKIEQRFKNASVTVSGIPVRPDFLENKPVDELRKKYGLAKKTTALVLSGGHGLIALDKVVKLIASTKEKLNIIAIAGKNESLKKKLNKIKVHDNQTLEVIGWTDKIDEFMRLADFIITKPGGSTVTECINLGKPILAISPIPGQEEKNVYFILENQLGKVINSAEDLSFYIKAIVGGEVKFNHLPQINSAKIIWEEIKKVTG